MPSKGAPWLLTGHRWLAADSRPVHLVEVYPELETHVNAPKLSARLGAEFLATFWLVFGGCGSAVLAAKFLSDPDKIQLGIGFVGVALAFGLTVLTMAYAVGHVSGGHFNPAVTIGLAVAGRFEWKDAPPHVVTQVVAGLVAGGVLDLIASGKKGFVVTGHLAANGYGDHSPGGYSLLAQPWSPRSC